MKIFDVKTWIGYIIIIIKVKEGVLYIYYYFYNFYRVYADATMKTTTPARWKIMLILHLMMSLQQQKFDLGLQPTSLFTLTASLQPVGC